MAITESAEMAYERAFEEHWTDVFRFALAWTNDWTAAEDLAQEAYLRMWNNRGHLDWNRPTTPVAALDEATQARWLDVRAAMTVLSPLERTALVMTAVEGATYQEAAEVLGTTAGALRAAVNRARAKLETA